VSEDGELSRVVSVWGKPQKIWVYRKSKSVWVAVGEYMDETAFRIGVPARQ
jgi:hypothetical protein